MVVPRRAGTPLLALLREQLARHAVALLSLFIALSGLAYNTWRNETSERQRNVREAAFVSLTALAEFQQLIDRRYFGGERGEASRIEAWGRIALVRDLGSLVSPQSAQRADAAFDTWQAQAAALDQGSTRAEALIAASLRDTREQLLADLRQLR